MKLYRLRYERWKRGLHAGRFAPFSRDFEAATRKAAIKEAGRLWDEIISDNVSTRFVELIEVVDWIPHGITRPSSLAQ